MSDKLEKLIKYALFLIAKKRYTEQELKLKLKKKKIGTEEDIKKAIKRIKKLNYINDDEYTTDYIHQRIKLNPRGKRIIKMELKRKGIDEKCIERAFEDIEINEEELALKVLERKKRVLDKLPQQKKWLLPVVLSVTTVIFCYLLFSVWLKCQLPEGILN